MDVGLKILVVRAAVTALTAPGAPFGPGVVPPSVPATKTAVGCYTQPQGWRCEDGVLVRMDRGTVRERLANHRLAQTGDRCDRLYRDWAGLPPVSWAARVQGRC